MAGLVFLIVLGTSIWVLVDANSLGFGKRQMQKGKVDASPWVWFLGCLALWIVVFPFYLVKRGRYKRLDSGTAPVSSVPVLATLSDSITQLERLSQLKDKGIISEDEFLAKKRVLLT